MFKGAEGDRETVTFKAGIWSSMCTALAFAGVYVALLAAPMAAQPFPWSRTSTISAASLACVAVVLRRCRSSGVQ